MRFSIRRIRRKQIGGALALVAAGALLWFLVASGGDALIQFFAARFPSDRLVVGTILGIERISQETVKENLPLDRITVEFLTGPRVGETIEIRDRSLGISELQPGERVMLAKNTEGTGESYYITDRFRLPALIGITMLFVFAAIVFGGMRGATALVGLLASIAILTFYIIPQIIAGADPVVASVIGAAAIAVISLYLAHGFNVRTTVALGGTAATLVFAVFLSELFVSLTHLVGLATDEAFYLRLGGGAVFDLRGILLGGIILGTLGVLDDVTVGQSATVEEISRANHNLSPRELYARGLSVGRDHIASLVNTLFLAYAGVALPLLVYLAVYQRDLPFWVVINGEPIAEEIVRTLAGSIALILAVPVTTALAAWVFGKRS